MFPEYATLNLLLILSLWLLLPGLKPSSQVFRQFVLLPLIFIQVFYIHWRYNETLEPFLWSPEAIWQYTFFISESLVVMYAIWQCITLIRYTDRTAHCDALLQSSEYFQAKSVDLFVPTLSESRAILSATIAAAKNDRYLNLNIFVCDDGNREWLRDLCTEQGVFYLSRSRDQPLRTKAANLDWCIAHGNAEYIVCIDADFQIDPDLTTRLTSFFADSDIGLVQAPQHFRNLDPVQRNLFGGSAWTEEQRFFFDVSLPSRDAWDNALCVGSCWATRREVINRLGGFPVDSIVEDVYFGYRVKSLGYRTVYLNERLATGLAAEDTPSYISQRSRWCLGAMALLSAPHGPFRARGLKLIDRIFYLEISFYWITHIHMFFLLIAPAMYGFLGYKVFLCTTEELLAILLPKSILLCVVFYWISEGRCMPMITPVQKTLTVFHVIPSILQGVLFPRSAKFKVTRKDIQYNNRTIHWSLAAPFLIVGALTISSMAVVSSQDFNQFDWSDYSAYNTLLSAYSLITVFLCCLVCVDKPSSSEKDEPETPLRGSWWRTVTAIKTRIFY